MAPLCPIANGSIGCFRHPLDLIFLEWPKLSPFLGKLCIANTILCDTTKIGTRSLCLCGSAIQMHLSHALTALMFTVVQLDLCRQSWPPGMEGTQACHNSCDLIDALRIIYCCAWAQLHAVVYDCRVGNVAATLDCCVQAHFASASAHIASKEGLT